MLSQNIFHCAETDRVALSQHSLGRASQELGYELVDGSITQPIPDPPHAGSTPSRTAAGQLMVLVVCSSYVEGGLRKAFVQVSAVRIAPDKLHSPVIADQGPCSGPAFDLHEAFLRRCACGVSDRVPGAVRVRPCMRLSSPAVSSPRASAIWHCRSSVERR